MWYGKIGIMNRAYRFAMQDELAADTARIDIDSASDKSLKNLDGLSFVNLTKRLVYVAPDRVCESGSCGLTCEQMARFLSDVSLTDKEMTRGGCYEIIP